MSEKENFICPNPECRNLASKDAHFCAFCRTQLDPDKQLCIHCGAEMDPRGSFCGNCGRQWWSQKKEVA